VETNRILTVLFQRALCAQARCENRKLDLGMTVRANIARPHMTSEVSLSNGLLSLGWFCSAVSNEKSDQSIWVCESACCEISRSSLLSQSRFSEAVS